MDENRYLRVILTKGGKSITIGYIFLHAEFESEKDLWRSTAKIVKRKAIDNGMLIRFKKACEADYYEDYLNGHRTPILQNTTQLYKRVETAIENVTTLDIKDITNTNNSI